GFHREGHRRHRGQEALARVHDAREGASRALPRGGRGSGRECTVMTGMPPVAPAIRVQGLEKSYGKLAVLRGVDLEVSRGSVLSLLGSNGAGKTTAVRILSTLLRADAGTAVVHGFDVTTEPGRVRESISLTGQ